MDLEADGDGRDLSKHYDHWRTARQLDESFRLKHPEIPWAGLIGSRNVVMHAYEYLKPELIKEMAENDVPVLLMHCVQILGEE